MLLLYQPFARRFSGFKVSQSGLHALLYSSDCVQRLLNGCLFSPETKLSFHKIQGTNVK